MESNRGYLKRIRDAIAGKLTEIVIAAVMGGVMGGGGGYYALDEHRLEEKKSIGGVLRQLSDLDKFIRDSHVDSEQLGDQSGGETRDLGNPSIVSKCVFENDGECDAAGYEGSTNLCPYDTDRSDCSDKTPLGRDESQDERCASEEDGNCDAFGLWKSTNSCPAGTDLIDCRGYWSTSDECRFEEDGQCDAMGNPGSTNRCPVGTDLVDCRGPSR